MVSASWLMAVSMLNFFASHCLTLRSFRSRSILGGDVLRDTRKSPVFFYQFQERYLVGGWPSPLKNDGVNVSWDICWDDDMSNWMEKTCSKPPTSYIWSQTGPEVTENLYQTCSSGGFSGLRWITYFGIWSSQMDPNGCRMTACDFSWIFPPCAATRESRHNLL